MDRIIILVADFFEFVMIHYIDTGDAAFQVASTSAITVDTSSTRLLGIVCTSECSRFTHPPRDHSIHRGKA
jgi:hypothetical protein